MLTDTRLRHLKPKEKLYKVNDRDGLYVAVTPAGTISFRYNYSINGRQETVTFGRYGVGGITLAEARERLNEANDSVMIYDSLSNRSSLLRLKKRGHTVINTSCNESDEIESVTFSQLVSLKTQHGDLLLLDVREPAERNVISIGGCTSHCGICRQESLISLRISSLCVTANQEAGANALSCFYRIRDLPGSLTLEAGLWG